MLSVRTEKANNAAGYKKNPFFDSPGSDSYSLESLPMDNIRTPGSNGSKVVTFESSALRDPVSPPKIKRTTVGSDFPDFPPVEKVSIGSPCDSSTWATSVSHSVTPSGSKKKAGQKGTASPTQSDTSTLATSQTHDDTSPSAKKIKGDKKTEAVAWEMSNAFRKKIKGMKKIIPKMIQAMNGSAPKRVDLTDLTVATLCLMPRNGAGMEEGRKCFERMRTSLMLHMIQQHENGSWIRQDESKYEGDKARKMKGQLAQLNNRLHDCLTEKGSNFAEKVQEIVRIVKEGKEAIEDIDECRDEQSSSKNALELRNMTCLKLLSGMYRDVVSSYEASYSSGDGLTLMVVASAYFAMGRFETSLAIYQKAGAKLRESLTTDPECIVHCAKLFNNMGVVYYEMKKYEKAMQTFQRALQLFHDENEDNYAYWVSAIMDQASIMNNMAYTLVKFKQYDDASDLVDASFELQQLLPSNIDATTSTIMTVSTLSSMAFIYQRTKKYKQALDTYTACAQLQAKSSIHGDSDKVDIMKKMVDITKKVKNHEKRVKLLRCVLLYQQSYLTEDDEEIWETNAALGEALQALAETDGISV
ncbi:hypothetical protein HJC23_001996 [Cyclotella cryptica]|uniref:Uncharacterized protein n=1 Tax=Cyclotella cryptica TaxID=29204 RepID=A0ABD3P266_9STRA